MKLFLTSRVVQPHLIPILLTPEALILSFDQMALEKLSVLLSVRGGRRGYMRDREVFVILCVKVLL